MLYTEYEAAARFGIDPDDWFTQPRHSRALKAGFVTIENAVAAMRAFDVAEEAKEKNK